MSIARRRTPEIKLPLNNLQKLKPEIAGLGLSYFRQLGVEPFFAKPVGWLYRPTMRNTFIDASQSDLFCRPIMYSVPMRRGGVVPLQMNLRADNGGDINNLLLFRPES